MFGLIIPMFESRGSSISLRSIYQTKKKRIQLIISQKDHNWWDDFFSFLISSKKCHVELHCTSLATRDQNCSRKLAVDQIGSNCSHMLYLSLLYSFAVLVCAIRIVIVDLNLLRHLFFANAIYFLISEQEYLTLSLPHFSSRLQCHLLLH